MAGDFAQVYVGGNWEAFQASGTHRVVLNGSAPQTVSFFHGIRNRGLKFVDLEGENGIAAV